MLNNQQLSSLYASIYKKEEEEEVIPLVEEVENKKSISDLYEEILRESLGELTAPFPQEVEEEIYTPGTPPSVKVDSSMKQKDIDYVCENMYRELNKTVLKATISQSDKMLASLGETLTRYENRMKSLLEEKNTPVEPEVILSEEVKELNEEVIEQPVVEKSYIEMMGDQLGKYLKKTDKTIKEDVVFDKTYHALQMQINQLKMMMTEATRHGTVVSGMGSTPGGGEVRILNMDDVAQGAQWTPGSTLVWNGKEFAPGQGGGGGGVPFVADFPPAPGPQGLQVGQLWFNSSNGVLYIYYIDPAGTPQWLEAND
jgi:hypothetical protein